MLIKKSAVNKILLAAVSFFCVFLPLFLISVYLFTKKYYGSYKTSEIIFFINTTLLTVNYEMIKPFLVNCVLYPSLFALLIFFLPEISKLCYYLFYVQKNTFRFCLPFLALIVAINVAYIINHHYHFTDYFNLKEGNFYEKHFIKPSKALLKFPEQKRNLIVISLESMEETYKNASFYGQSLLFPLEEIEHKDAISFSKYIDGPYQGPTQPSLMAMFTGLPSTFYSYGHINTRNPAVIPFQKVYSLGKILSDEGYNTMSIKGSDGNFSGTNLFLEHHGVMHNLDKKSILEQASENHKKPVSFWGYSDEVVFEMAKKEIERLEKEDKPFFVLIQTMDTHMDELPNIITKHYFENRYYNIITNTAEKTADFVKWVQRRSTYQNTTIILVGDHFRASRKFRFPLIRRVYNLFINAVQKKVNSDRDFMQVDLFPSILEAIGVKVEGHKLGLGTSIFSQEKTLTEQYNRKYLHQELSKKDKIYDSLF